MHLAPARRHITCAHTVAEAATGNAGGAAVLRTGCGPDWRACGRRTAGGARTRYATARRR